MRKRLLIGLALYLACGVVFGLVTDRQQYGCRYSLEPAGTYAALDETKFEEATSAEVDCLPIIGAADRLVWVATTTPAWLPLLIRNVVDSRTVTTFR